VAVAEPRWHPAALDEAEEARDWYMARSPLAAHGFVAALDDAVEAVVATPDRWPLGRHGCREYVFQNRYPFILVYRVGPPVIVVAVAHQRRRPGFWRGR